MFHILVVDDDEAVRELVSAYLTAEGLRVSLAANAVTMAAVLEAEPVDLVVLDLRLPDADGLELMRTIRAREALPVIILSGKNADVDRIVGLEVGADDYLTKPFNPRELLARIKAVMRRVSSDGSGAKMIGAGNNNGNGNGGTSGGTGDTLRAISRFAGWTLDFAAQRLTGPEGREVELTRAEFALLSAFVRRPQRVLSRDQLLDLTHNDGGEVFDRSIDVLILRLRRKIEANPSQPKLIKTERGAGYIFDAVVRNG